MLIGILETGHPPDDLRAALGSYREMFARMLTPYGFDFQGWGVVDGEFPEDVHAADAWLLTGSRHGAYDDLPFIPPLEDFIRRAHAARVPLVGICFGHQIIAQALGGKVEKFAGGWSVGAQVYDFEGVPRRLMAWHQDQVTALPPGAEVIGTSPFCRYAALRYGDLALTVQAHPEYGRAFIEGLIETRGRGVVPDAQLDAARASLDAALDAEAVAAQIAAFLHSAHVARAGAT